MFSEPVEPFELILKLLMKRAARILVVVVILALVLLWAFMPAPVPADFSTVQRGSLQVTVEEEGRTRVRDCYVISAPLPGRMSRIDLEPGDSVIAGKTLLAEFHPIDPALLDVRTRAELEARVRAATAALGGARADRERVQADVGFARSELQRSQQLIKEKVISQRELEAAQQQAQTAERGLQSADFAVRTAEYNLQVARASLLQVQGGGGAAIKCIAGQRSDPAPAPGKRGGRRHRNSLAGSR